MDRGLFVGDIAVDSRQNPQVLIITLRQSKTDPFGSGAKLYVGRSGDAICPVSAMLAYLAVRPHIPGPLFILQDGTPLSRVTLVSHLREAITNVGLDATNFSGHNFRIGAASAAAKAGFSDSFIQSRGRWRSSAFTRYIRTPIADIASATTALASPHGRRAGHMAGIQSSD